MPKDPDFIFVRDKNKKIITIYGSYFPLKVKEKLIIVREYLKKYGFINTKLVSDYPNNFFETDYNENNRELKRSEFCIKKSDLNIFIYFFDGTHSGVQYELDYIIHKGKTNYLIFVEEQIVEKKKIYAFSTLIEQKLTMIGRRFIPFSNNNGFLKDIVYQRVIDFFT
ncbi:MAG: hypothetical protein GF311_01450 [Candidatus Lokiarchaeota archaeon]|nr:hypothetical protein [Candidatus Lokiarchaeota archaeon]